MKVDVLVIDTQVIHAIRSALRIGHVGNPHVTLWFPSGWDEFERRANHGLFDVAFLQPTFFAPPKTLPTAIGRILRLQECLPSGSLIFFPTEGPEGGRLVKELRAFPLSIILFKKIDDHPRNILRALSRSWVQRRVAAVSMRGRTKDEREAMALVKELLSGWPPRGRARESAEGMGASPRTVRRRLKDKGFPSPKHLVDCGRLMELIPLKHLGILKPSKLAWILGVGKAETLDRMARRLAGLSLKEILGDEHEEEITRGFLDEISV